VNLGTRASEAVSINGVWVYGRNFSVSELGRGHVIRNVQIALMHVLIQVLDLIFCYKMIINNLVDISTFLHFRIAGLLEVLVLN